MSQTQHTLQGVAWTHYKFYGRREGGEEGKESGGRERKEEGGGGRGNKLRR